MDGCFSEDFSEARTKFLGAARNAGAELWSETLAARGPDDAELGTDVAWLGPRDAAQVLVTISSTHGVEGFFGSAVQPVLMPPALAALSLSR
jgi:polar amino acid transport system ATP-binding protein